MATPENGQQREGEGGHINQPLFEDVSSPDNLAFQFISSSLSVSVQFKEGKILLSFVVLEIND